MFEIKPIITKQLDKDDAYYTLGWSPLKKVDRYVIQRNYPAVSGLFELYRLDEEKKLNLLVVAHTWYGGLRSNVRAAIDPDAKQNPLRRQQLEDATLYARYSCSDSFGDLQDVVWFLHNIYFPNDVRVSSSERYQNIFLEEMAPDQVRWVE